MHWLVDLGYICDGKQNAVQTPLWKVMHSLRLHLCVSVPPHLSRAEGLAADAESPLHFPTSILWTEWAGNTSVMAPIKCVSTWAHQVQTTGTWANTLICRCSSRAKLGYSLLQTMLIKQSLSRNVWYGYHVIIPDILYVDDLIQSVMYMIRDY